MQWQNHFTDPLKSLKSTWFLLQSLATPQQKKLFTLIPLNALAEQFFFFHFAKKQLHPYISDRASKINKAESKAIGSWNKDPGFLRQAASKKRVFSPEIFIQKSQDISILWYPLETGSAIIIIFQIWKTSHVKFIFLTQLFTKHHQCWEQSTRELPLLPLLQNYSNTAASVATVLVNII